MITHTRTHAYKSIQKFLCINTNTMTAKTVAKHKTYDSRTFIYILHKLQSLLSLANANSTPLLMYLCVSVQPVRTSAITRKHHHTVSIRHSPYNSRSSSKRNEMLQMYRLGAIGNVIYNFILSTILIIIFFFVFRWNVYEFWSHFKAFLIMSLPVFCVRMGICKLNIHITP